MNPFSLHSTLLLFFIVLGNLVPVKAQEREKSAEAQIAALERQVENMQHTFQKITKGIDDLSWYDKLADYAYTDKVIITGPPPAVIKNPTAQGANNPILFSAYVFVPKTIDIHKKYPLIVLPHGGVHAYFETSYAHIIRELMVQEYVVVAPDYRGSTGYGAGFYRLIDYGGLEVDDVQASRDYMLENYDFLDKGRVGIMGWSHGGMITLLSLFNHPENYAVGYAGVPVSDLVARMGYKSQSYRDLYAADYHMGKQAVDNVAEYRKRSPAWNAAKLKTPLLVHTNTNDEDVNVLEVEHLIQALKAEGKKFDYEIYKDKPGGHHYDRIDNYGAKEIRLKVYKFLEQYLKPNKPFNNLDELIKASYFPRD
ncbi:S9 family peptidase [Olivibacter sp. XZL3]|uniref:alpha/beta hydrolase family protein n=1 Tax=Olivibacter sp. XZL3 TaxID=1735116 RepID=UPI0019823B5E|nr:alpha/beta fold hydrolase [Olivibacter sp. XZL3]